ncbi:MAG: D-isomer specific 2-hydroxyacid dehydrogenase family protein [Candidatus Roseilinea sp.]|nr:MAG: D-isomer specific 2-hydroxyacid dehydrogenase family protein [Candidatus Roseilinea sp.]
MYRVIVTDHAFPSLDPERGVLAGLAEVIDCSPLRTEDDVICAARDADALIIGFAPITARVMDALPRLRCVVRYGVGYETIDVPAAAARGIQVANVPDYCIPEVADHTMALLLALARRVIPLDASVRRGEWATLKIAQPAHRIEGQTLGLIGIGRIGSAVAQRALGFGMRVIAYDKYLPPERAQAAGATRVDLDTLLREADFISIHAPLTPETRHLINAEAIGKLKPSAYLINVARGAIVDTLALADALQMGKLAGAALDVFEQEPLPADHPIRNAPNVILHPHAAWYSEEALTQLQVNAAEEVARALRGEPLKNLLTPAKL